MERRKQAAETAKDYSKKKKIGWSNDADEIDDGWFGGGSRGHQHKQSFSSPSFYQPYQYDGTYRQSYTPSYQWGQPKWGKESYKPVEYKQIDYSKKRSFASDYKYVQPDYIKIKKQLRNEQIRLNKLGYMVKISYGITSIFKKEFGITRITVENLQTLKLIREFVDKLSSIGRTTINFKDTNIFKCLFTSHSSFVPIVGGCNISKTDLDSYTKYMEYINGDRGEKKDREDGKSKGSESLYGEDYIDGNLKESNSQFIEDIKTKLLNKVRIQKVNKKTISSLRSGKRINRSFISGLSYKPLLKKEFPSQKKKQKVFCILDNSGSMGPGKDYSEYYNAFHFMAALKDSGLFDSLCVTSSDDFLYKVGDDNKMVCRGGCEGFDRLEQRMGLHDYPVTGYDYYLLFTDCYIAPSCIDTINDIMGNKKHIIFDFNGKHTGSMYSVNPKFNIKRIRNNVQDMIDVLVSYVN